MYDPVDRAAKVTSQANYVFWLHTRLYQSADICEGSSETATLLYMLMYKRNAANYLKCWHSSVIV